MCTLNVYVPDSGTLEAFCSRAHAKAASTEQGVQTTWRCGSEEEKKRAERVATEQARIAAERGGIGGGRAVRGG